MSRGPWTKLAHVGGDEPTPRDTGDLPHNEGLDGTTMAGVPPETGGSEVEDIPALDLANEVARSAFKAMAFGGPRRYPRVGRYRVTQTLGQGGMGVVFRAHDDELARPVALKVLHNHRDGARRHAADTRLLREAQAMAQLSHPNVVQIYDVGEYEGQVFIAMELVQGQTLGQWLTELGPPAARAARLDEVLDRFVQAGRGLAAAHAVGLVHRDFKPANVLVGDDGGVRVLDFGLARGPFRELADSIEGERNESMLAELSELALHESMTVTGSILGTPAYMSPEQLRGEEAGAAADQFSFCVALYEALFGARPYAGASMAEIAKALDRGQRDPAPREVSVPAWVLAVLDRGLEVDPHARWPSMDALLEALLDNPQTRRRRRFALAGIALLATSLAGGSWGLEQRARAECEAAGEAIHASWSAADKSRLRETFLATDAPGASESWDRVATWIDGWTGDWREAETRVCLDGRDAPKDAEPRARCLERQRWQLDSLLEVFADADRATVQHAVAAAAALPSVERCDEPGWLAAEGGALGASDEQLRRDLVEVFTLERAGRYEDALALAETAHAAAVRTGDAALEAEALRDLGGMRKRNGDDQGAADSLRSAYFMAGGLGYDRVALEAAEELILVVGRGLARHREGHDWADHVRMTLRHMGLDPERDRFELFSALGHLYDAESNYAEALAAHERAYELMREQLPPTHPEIAVALTNVGASLHALGEYERALETHERALGLAQRALGPAHPDVAEIHAQIAKALGRLSRYDEALAAHGHALSLQEANLGPDHPNVAHSLVNMAGILRDRGEYAGASALLARALSIYERSYGAEHPTIASTLGTLASVTARLGEPQRAIEMLERALAIKQARLGPDHGSVAITSFNLGMRQQEIGDLDGALASFTRAAEIDEAMIGPEHPDYAADLDSIGTVLHALGEDERALENYERARAIRERVLPADHADHAASFDLIGELLRERGEPARAVDLHRRALVLREGAYGSEHRLCATTRIKLGLALTDIGELDEARAQLERALAILDASEGETSVDAALALEGLAQIDVAAGEPGRAIEQLERAIERRGRRPGDPARLADARVELARLLVAAGKQRAGEDQAQLARASYVELGPRRSGALLELDLWLDRSR